MKCGSVHQEESQKRPQKPAATVVATPCEGLEQERSECGGEKSVRKFYLRKVCPIAET